MGPNFVRAVSLKGEFVSLSDFMKLSVPHREHLICNWSTREYFARSLAHRPQR